MCLILKLECHIIQAFYSQNYSQFIARQCVILNALSVFFGSGHLWKCFLYPENHPFPFYYFFFNPFGFFGWFPCNMHSQFYFLSLGLWLAPQKALWLKNTKWEVVFSGFVNLLFSFNIHYIFRYLFFLNFEYFKLFFKNSLKNSSAFYISVHTNLDSRKHYGSSKHFENWF